MEKSQVLTLFLSTMQTPSLKVINLLSSSCRHSSRIVGKGGERQDMAITCEPSIWEVEAHEGLGFKAIPSSKERGKKRRRDGGRERKKGEGRKGEKGVREEGYRLFIFPGVYV